MSSCITTTCKLDHSTSALGRVRSVVGLPTVWLLLLIGSPPLFADWPTDPLMNLTVAGGPGDQYSAVSVVDSTGGLYSTYLDYDGTTNTLRVQRYDAEANPIWSTPVDVANVAYPNYTHNIAIDASDRCWIAFHDGTDIAVAVVSTSGVVDWSMTLSSALSTSFRVPLITALTDGTFIVAWESIDWMLGESAIVAHRIGNDGFLYWGSAPQTLDYSPGEFDVGPEVTATTDGAFVLTWVRDGATGLTPHDLFAQKFDGGPTAQWNGGQPLLVDDSDDAWEEHRVIADNAGGVAIAWERWAAGEARVQWLTATGFERFGFEGLSPAQPSGLVERLPSITFLGPEQLLVVWCADQGATFGGVFAQLISESGQWQWGLDGVAVAPLDGLLETDVRVASTSDHGRVAYFAPPAAGMDEQLHVVEVDATGALTWSQPAVACAISSSKADLTILSGADNSSYITWSEDRLGGANQDVFAQNVNPDGSLGPPPARFVRGECSGDGVYDITDAIVLLAHLFGTAPLPNCPDACDRDDDGALVVTDVIWMLGELFGGGFVPPPAPGCNPDTTADPLDCPTPSACP